MQQPVTNEDGEKFSNSKAGSDKVKTSRPPYLTKLLLVIKLLAGVSLLVLSIQGIQWGNLVTGFRSANLAWLTTAILAVLFGLFLKIWRWAIFVKNYQIRASISRLFSAYFVGQAVNILLPLRGGEIVRIGYFVGEPKILPEIMSTVVLEKYLDLLALAVCIIMVSIKFSLDNILNLRSWLFPLTGLFTIVLLISVLLGPAIWKKIRGSKLLPKSILAWIDKWVEASLWLRNPRKVLPALLLTALIWSVMWLTNMLLFKSLGMQVDVTAAGLVLTLVYVGLFPALMPGNIGPFYFFARLALLPFGVIQNQAFVYAVVLHAIVTLPPLLGGAIGLILRSDRQGVS